MMFGGDFIFGNPAGAWALIGLIAVAAIHLIQRQSRRVTVTTRFLIETLPPVSRQGRRIERIRNSLPLWLQLLVVLLVTWLLVQPRWLSSDSQQTVVVVLDSSISMDAFREEMKVRLDTELPTLAGAARRTNWIVMESDPARPRLYAGPSLDAAMASVDGWRPRLGSHDIHPALRLAQTIAGRDGRIVLVSDHADPLPSGVDWLGVGAPIPNVGWVGARVDGTGWSALVRNHHSQVATRNWAIRDANGQLGPPTTLTLEGGETRMLRGKFPEDGNRVTVELSPDQFQADDQLPLIQPVAKELRIAVRGAGRLATFLERLRGSFADAVAADSDPDLQIVECDVADSLEVPGTSIAFTSDSEASSRLLPGVVVAEDHELVANLSWQGLLVRESRSVPLQDGDEVLIWQADRPLVFLRGRGKERALVVNFDVSQSNADRLPAFIVMLNRFVEQVRRETVGFTQANFDVNQPLDIATDDTLPIVEGRDDGVLRAPERVGFFRVMDGEVARLDGAAQFADPREADFRQAESGGSLEATASKAFERNSQVSGGQPILYLVLFGVVLWSWWAVDRRGGLL